MCNKKLNIEYLAILFTLNFVNIYVAYLTVIMLQRYYFFGALDDYKSKFIKK